MVKSVLGWMLFLKKFSADKFLGCGLGCTLLLVWHVFPPFVLSVIGLYVGSIFFLLEDLFFVFLMEPLISSPLQCNTALQ